MIVEPRSRRNSESAAAVSWYHHQRSIDRLIATAPAAAETAVLKSGASLNSVRTERAPVPEKLGEHSRFRAEGAKAGILMKYCVEWHQRQRTQIHQLASSQTAFALETKRSSIASSLSSAKQLFLVNEHMYVLHPCSFFLVQVSILLIKNTMIESLDPSFGMRLSKLLALGGHSPVLQALACTDGYIASLRCLRMVNKEISQLALLGLETFSLTLKGVDSDTCVKRASLLKQTKLSELNVHIRLTGTCHLGEWLMKSHFLEFVLTKKMCVMIVHSICIPWNCMH